ncbi:MAG: efflux RND transporter permease subunit [Candidatus Edwardsbacteria bacterium]|nr:efflux RND transporter permease subunit [Candidatus Edwardsbacteria bacterium]
MWLTRLALKYPISTFLFAVTILVLGLVSLSQLPIDLLPDISIPTVSVSTSYPGANPLDMEQTVTTAIERAVSSVNNVDYIQSTTREGSSQVRINFNWGANTDVAMVDVIQRVNRAQRRLPDGVDVPTVQRFDVTSQAVCNIVVYGDIDQRDLYDLAVNVIQPQIEHLPGVATAPVSGGRRREIHVVLDRNRLQALGITVQSVLAAIAAANVTVPSGDIKTGAYDYALKTESKFNMVAPIEDIVVRMTGGVPVRIRAVGRVEDSYEEQNEISRINGHPGLTLRVQKLANANTVGVVDNVRRALPRLNGIPATVKLSLTADQSRYIRQTIDGLAREALMGAVLAMLVILLFLRNVRGTLIVVTAIPLSILITFIMFRFGNVTLNIMTFGGLALAVGRLVDDSIVELEAISRHYGLRTTGRSKIEATLEAAQEVAAPIFVSTLTTVIVFLPVVFLSGVARLLFIPLTITIAVALFGSFFVSRTVTPLMCLQYLQPERPLDRASAGLWDRVRARAHDWIALLDSWYEARLRWTLGHRRRIILGISGAALLSGLLVFLIGTEFFPDQDEGQMSVSVRLPVGSRAEQTDSVVAQVERILEREVPEVQTMIADIGSGWRNTGSHAGSVQLTLKPAHQRRRSVFQIVKEVRPKLMKVPGASVFMGTGGFMRFLLNFGAGAPIDVEIQGFDLETGSRLAREVAEIVRSVPGATDVQVSREDNLPELRVRIDRNKAGALGVSVADIANTINTCIGGTTASLYTDPVSGNAYNILVRLDQRYRSGPEDIERIVLAGAGGAPVLLGSVADIELAKAPVQITRKNQERLVDVTANVAGRSLGSVAGDIDRKLATLAVPAGFTVTLKGNVEQQRKTFRDLFLAFLLAIMLVYVVMASQFQSFLDPFIIMFTVPLGIVGVLWTLFLTRTTLSVTSGQGIIVMVGIVVSNGILLVDYTNHLRARGMALHDAVITAGRTRLKPIVMTMLTTVLGLVPMAVGLGGESTQAPLAIAVIGGLSVSTALTLFFVPALYTVFEDRIKRKPAA